MISGDVFTPESGRGEMRFNIHIFGLKRCFSFGKYLSRDSEMGIRLGLKFQIGMYSWISGLHWPDEYSTSL